MNELIINNKLLSIILTLCFTRISFAAPVLVDISYFSGSETVLTFDELTEGQNVTTQYLSYGVDFTNNPIITASTSTGLSYEAWSLFNNPGNTVIQNFSYESIGGFNTPSPMVIDFSLSPQLIGFDVISDSGQGIYRVTSALSGEVTSFLLETYIPDRFYAFYDPDGISQLIIDPHADFIGVGAMAINDLRFENVTTVPLPPAFILFISGFTLILYRTCKAKIA